MLPQRNDVKIVISPPRLLKIEDNNVEIVICPLHYEDSAGNRTPLTLKSTIFEANCITDQKPRYLPVDKGACLTLQDELAHISESVFSELLPVLKQKPEILPPAAKKLLSSSATSLTFAQCFRPFWLKDTHWFKLHDDCQVYDAETNTLIEEQTKKGKYKILLNLSAVYLGAHGPTGYCASILAKVQQVVVKQTKEPTVPQSLALDVDDFFSTPAARPQTLMPPPPKKARMTKKTTSNVVSTDHDINTNKRRKPQSKKQVEFIAKQNAQPVHTQPAISQEETMVDWDHIFNQQEVVTSSDERELFTIQTMV